MRRFTFYRTFYPVLNKDTPVTVGFERVSRRILAEIKGYKHVWMHSGNWWNLKPEERSPSKIISSLKKLAKVCNVDGIMSLNIPPRLYGKYYDIWNYPRELRHEALENSLRLSLELRELLDLDIPIYCCYEVGRFDDALEWYKRASEVGFTEFGAGFAGFLRGRPLPQAYERIVEVIVAARVACGSDIKFHASGVGSLRLLALVFYVGATSADGSTPIRAALANRTVYDLRGKAFKVDEIKTWSCECGFCEGRKPRELIDLFKKSYSARVLHNSIVWDEFIRRIIEVYNEGTYEDFLESLMKSRTYLKAYRYAKELLRKSKLM